MPPDACAFTGSLVHDPSDGIDPMRKQVRQRTAAIVPEPTPSAENWRDCGLIFVNFDAQHLT